MTIKQWRALMAAGAFSGLLMADVVHGENAGVKPDAGGGASIAAAESPKPKKKRSTKRRKTKKSKEAAPAQSPA